MIDAKETAAALYGLWRLVRGGDSCFDYFSNSEAGFWRSFIAAAVLAPLQALYQLTLYLSAETPPPLFRLTVVESLEYVILWLLYPVVMLSVVQLLDRDERYFRYMTTYNWFQMGVGLIVLPIAILSGFGLMPDGLGGVFDSITFVMYIVYAIFIARGALDLTVGAGCAIVLLDIVLTLIVGQITLRMLT